MTGHFKRNAQVYQLALTTPGISPLDASSLKHILHIWNLPIKPRGLPQSLHLLYLRTLNFGFLVALTISDVFAISILYFLANGMPKSLSNSNDSLAVPAVVFIVMSIPCTFTILSTSTSGNITCSFRPNE